MEGWEVDERLGAEEDCALAAAAAAAEEEEGEDWALAAEEGFALVADCSLEEGWWEEVVAG